ncbi:MAG TPA: MFS transporter [Candidatus Limnocylindria bacterium]
MGWQTKRDRTLGPFAHRAFAVYWAGGLLSNIGTWLQNVAGSVFIYDRTGSAFAVGLLNFATFLPLLLFSVTGGVLSDRFDRRTIVVASQSLSLLAASALAIAVASGGATELFVIATAFALQTSWSVAKPSMIAILPALVPRAQLNEAVGLNTLQFILGQIGGPVLATAILASGGYAWAFGINAATFVGPILAMAYLYRRDLGRGVSREMQRASAAVRSGIGAYVRAQPWVVSALLAVISTSAILEVVRTTAPVLVAQRLGAPSTEAGLVIAAQSTGSALGLLAYIPMRRWDISRQIPVIGLALQAAGLIAVSIATTLPIAAAGVAAIGCGFSLCFPIVTGVLQTEVPDAMRGRLMSFHQMAHLGNRPFTALAAGAIAATFGVPAACLAALALVPIGLFAVRATWRGLPVASPPEPVPAGSA